ncbi:MAG: hypothetical protein ACRDOL_42505 [Streptosporangiaceae bacterium]
MDGKTVWYIRVAQAASLARDGDESQLTDVLLDRVVAEKGAPGRDPGREG